MIKKYSILLGILLCSCLLIVGCSTKSELRQKRMTQNKLKTADYYLNLANEADGVHAVEYQLQAAVSYVRASDVAPAQAILRNIRLDALKSATRKSILNARLSLLKKDLRKAQFLLEKALEFLQENKAQSEQPRLSSGTKRSSKAERIALLLPSTGPHAQAAKTIRDGFFAAYYQSRASQDPNSSVKIYDTGKGNKVLEAYELALEDEPNFIVGPLTKAEVQSIAKLDLSIPVLALNTISDTQYPVYKLYQFGLLPEDEVMATVDYAIEQGHRKALVLSIQNDWGDRVAESFKRYWESRGGSIVDSKSFKKARVDSKVKALLKAKKDSKREDADMIFLAATPETARQIKPLLNFYHAENLPVFATSAVYTGSPAPNEDSDLNGIQFCDMPWVLQHSHQLQEIQSKIEKVWGEKANRAPRFFALGMDAYKLANQLIRSERFPSKGISGLTGDLKINPYQHVQRGLVCVKFEKGVPIPELEDETDSKN